MRVGRTRARLLVTLAVLLAAPVGTGPLAAAPAAGHGAPASPISRTLACAPDGPHVASAACQAAIAASGGADFADWDNLRLPGVAGRDREVVPDGALCSGGIDRYAGLDLAREDWPTTELPPGSPVTFTYRTTIPHQGTFRLYLTRDGYDPQTPLAWADLAAEPFLTVTDPELVGDAYQLPGQTPGGVTGRHLIFTIWQNSDTPDTYYSCSDVSFGDPAAEPAAEPEPPPATGPAPATGAGPTPGGPALTSASPAGPATPLAVGVTVAGGLLVLAAVITLWVRQRRPGRGGSHRLRPRG